MPDPVGEDGWVALVDEASRVARDLEQRVEVVELYKQAIAAEPWSTKLWLAYCEWFWSLYTDCQTADAGWPEEEQIVGQELFTLEAALDLWHQGAQATQFRLNDSHEVWNRRISIELEQLSKDADRDGIDRLRQLFLDRLQTPHATWDETSQMFSTFVTKYDESAWESTMVQTTQVAKVAKDQYGQREEHELNLQRAVESGDQEVLQSVMKEYLEWETLLARKKPKKGAPSSLPILCVALYERALSSYGFGLDVTIWEDYITLLSIITSDHPQSQPPSILSVTQRATSHCPWSGMLWARYILGAECEALPFSDVEQIKHSATSTGVLDRDGMIGVLEVYAAWCGYLRRRTKVEGATDEDIDIADVGLPAALESVQHWGERLYGKEYKGDPSFRIERVLITYLTEKGSVEEGRKVWENLSLSSTYADSYEFWQEYYLWEMTVRTSGERKPVSSSLATEVLIRAVNRRTINWPEKIMEVYLRHCNNYEDVYSLVSAMRTVHLASNGVAKRRQKEAAEAAAIYAQQQPQVLPESTINGASIAGTSKRKRESVSEEPEGNTPKKAKNNKLQDEEKALREQHLKRDRENTTVIVTNLPPELTQTKLRQYFKEYGHINSVTLQTEDDEMSSTALIEFRSTEDVQSAILRDGKYFGDKQIHVEPGTSLTLYVTNFPATADEAYMRELFKECGQIFSIRYPSLKFNTRRRFCYITFRSRAAAAAATLLDNKLLDNFFRLQVKYSDPAAKKPREGAVVEGRQLHITGLDLTATEDELKEVFAKYGNVQGVRILKNMAGRSKGAAFIDFERTDDATEALALDKTKFKTQVLNVEFAKTTNFKPTATSGAGKGSSSSPAPDTGIDSAMSPSPVPDISDPTAQRPEGPSRAEISNRTIALMNIPDTVNDARIRAIIEPYGMVVKLVLRPDHSGAIVEFADVAAAGRASLGLVDHEIIPGRKLRTGGLKDLFQEKGEIRTDRIQIGQCKKSSSGFVKPIPPIRRPGPGGRGGLGSKRGLGYSAPKAPLKATGAADDADGNTPDNIQPKSNADFRALFVSGGKD